jgi:hypothetical protein
MILYYARSVFFAVNVSFCWLNNVSGSILSVPPTEAEYILTTMNEELLAASVLLAGFRIRFRMDPL